MRLAAILCLFGHHRRSRRSVRFGGEDFTARCRDCGRPMIRGESGKWAMSSKEAVPPFPSDPDAGEDRP
jgi:hypothetical protein